MTAIDGLLIDLDGVVYQNSQAITGAVETLQWLAEQNIPHLFVTNTTSKPREAIVSKLLHMGISITPEQIITPVSAVTQYLSSFPVPYSVAAYVAAPTLADFGDTPLWHVGDEAPPDAVVMGDIGEGWSFTAMNEMFSLLMANPECELIALGMTRYYKGDKGLQLDVGPFVQALAYAADREPVVIGKPARPFFEQACSQLGLPSKNVCMIGDDCRSDVAAAQAAGLQGVLVKTGKFQRADLSKVKADAILNSIAELPSLFE